MNVVSHINQFSAFSAYQNAGSASAVEKTQPRKADNLFYNSSIAEVRISPLAKTAYGVMSENILASQNTTPTPKNLASQNTMPTPKNFDVIYLIQSTINNIAQALKAGKTAER